jgi:rRNA maturation RNase YbeY
MLDVTVVRRTEGRLPASERLVEACRGCLQTVDCEAAREHADRVGLALSVAFVSDEEIARLSGQFRGCTHATDVLSFPLGERDPESGRMDLGEIVISRETAEREARHRRIETEDELLLYTVHGMLHLLGREDESDEGRAAMNRDQWAVLEKIGLDVAKLREGFDEGLAQG